MLGRCTLEPPSTPPFFDVQNRAVGPLSMQSVTSSNLGVVSKVQPYLTDFGQVTHGHNLIKFHRRHALQTSNKNSYSRHPKSLKLVL